MKERIAIIGAGPVGITIAINLHLMGFNVTVFEARSKRQIIDGNDERSVNITLSKRGIDALRKIGCADQVINQSAKVVGRKYYVDNSSYFVPYTLISDNCLYSIKRKHLEHILIEVAKKQGITIRFSSKLIGIDFLNRECKFSHGKELFHFDFLFGADGANSKVRNLLHTQCTISTNEFVYKRIDIDKENAERLALPSDVVNIFPSTNGMLLTLPNADSTHSGLLHIKNSTLDEIYNSNHLLQEYFPQLVENIEEFENKFFMSAEGAFGSLECTKWFWRNSILLLGDAAHAMLPFYGQGTNCGLEDVIIISDYIEQNKYNIQVAAKKFQDTRPASTTAISNLSYENLKNLEAHDFSETLTLKFLNLAIEEKFPDYRSEYFMVSFSNKSYFEALKLSKKYTSILSEYAIRDTIKGKTSFSETLLDEIYLKLKTAA